MRPCTFLLEDGELVEELLSDDPSFSTLRKKRDVNVGFIVEVPVVIHCALPEKINVLPCQ